MPTAEELLLYSKICGDAYGESKPIGYSNSIPQGWERLNLYIDNARTNLDYYAATDNGFDASIYYNSSL